MNEIFRMVANLLYWLADRMGLTYNEINIIVYFVLIPFIYMCLLDRLIDKLYFRIGFLIVLVITFLLMGSFREFSDKLFDASVKFLEWFEVIGWNYVEASVIICVVVPVLFFVVLALLVWT